MAKFEPDEPITKIRVQVHTAAVSDASTDSDIFIELFDWPPGLEQFGELFGAYSAEIDTADYNDFEGGDTRFYSLPASHFAGRIVNDIQRFVIHKGDDAGSGWGLGWVALWVNGKEYYTLAKMASDPDDPIWLEDGDRWSAPNFPRVLFEAPVIENLGLPDAGSNQDYSVDLTARGGRKPIHWEVVSPSGTAFTTTPTVAPLNVEGTQARFAAHTVTTKTLAPWTGVIRLTDADGRQSTKSVEMRVVFSLPAPTIAKIEPDFGWPPTAAEPSAIVVRVTSTDKDFDSRQPGATRVFFSGPKGKFVEAEIIDGELTSSALEVRVPPSARSGPIRVRTHFGEADSARFLVHPNGYRFVAGYSFVNQTKDGDNSDGFPDTFDWLRFEQAFGLDEMWLIVLDQAVCPNPVATFFYITVHDTLDNGCCHGFSLLSLQMRKGIVPTSAFATDDLPYPLDDALWQMTGPDRPTLALSNWIQGRQLVTVSDEGLSYYLDKIDSVANVEGDLCHMDARPALKDVQKALEGGLANPRMLAFAADCLPWRGHVVVPYAVEATSDGKQRIRVYDPNRPAKADDVTDDGSFITVNPELGTWSYIWSDFEKWDGLYMFTIPLTEYGHQNDWSIPGWGALQDLIGTFILGCAGTDSAGRIVQVSDDSGRRMFDDEGRLLGNSFQRPDGVRPVPVLGRGGSQRPMLVLTKSGNLDVTVEPTGSGGALFSLTRGPDRSLSVEDIAASLALRLDAAQDTIELSPAHGVASPIVRVSRRFPGTTESLSYALRLRGLEAGVPVGVRPTPDGRGVVLSAAGAVLDADVEVTHTSRTGRQRILETGAVSVVPSSVTTFRVADPMEIERPGALPLLVETDADGTGQSLTERRFGAGAAGPRVVAPHRITARPHITIGSSPPPKHREVRVDVSGSTGSTPGETLRFRALGHRARHDDGALFITLHPGTRPVRIQAEDETGRRSFPRTVFITIPTEGDRVVPEMTLYGDDVTIGPGATGSLLLGTYVVDEQTIGVALDLSIRDRRSGMGPERAVLVEGFAVAPPLAAIGGQGQAMIAVGGLAAKVAVRWAGAQPQSGEIELGRIAVSVPQGVALGSTFILRGKGTATVVRDGKTLQRELNVLPRLVRVWGGPEPTTLSIQASGEVVEKAATSVRADPAGVEKAANVGWWVERLSGVASIRQDAADPTQAIVTGQRAGFVRIKVVVGTTEAALLVRVLSAEKPTRLGLGLRGRALGHPLRRRSVPGGLLADGATG